jgi:hypothetical protein
MRTWIPFCRRTLARLLRPQLIISAFCLALPVTGTAADVPNNASTTPAKELNTQTSQMPETIGPPDSSPQLQPADTAPASAPVAEDDTKLPAVAQDKPVIRSSRDEQIDQFEEQLLNFTATGNDAVDLFNRYRDETRMRLWQFAMALDIARSTSDPVDVDPAEIERQHPGFPKEFYQLPENIRTVRDLYLDTLDVFFARNRLLEIIPDSQRAEAVGSELYGMQELRSDRDLIIVEVRYQALRIPRAFQQIKRMAVRAPVPLVWIAVEFWLAIFLFRWWRRWLPGTLVRMRNGLLAIRPRTEEVRTRLLGLWYIDQIRAPLEWLVLLTIIFNLLQFDGLDFVRDVGLIVARWIILTWFAVSLLNAYVARGAGGLTGETAQLRLKSLRLIAGWLLLLGLSVDLSTDLVGDAALTEWIWNIFTLLIFPLLCSLLSLWHMELYTRLEREGEPDIERKEYAAQRGIKRWVGSAKVFGLVLASWLRAVLIGRIEQFGSVRAATGLGSTTEPDDNLSAAMKLPADTRALLIKGHDDFSKYAMQERRALIKRINAGTGGVISIIGERGIGKNGFLRQVANNHEHKSIILDSRATTADRIIAEFGNLIGLDMNAANDAELNAALEAQDIKFIAIYDLHLLIRPVPGGMQVIGKLAELYNRVDKNITWGISVDSYAYSLIARLRSDHMLSNHIIQLRLWSEEQIGEFVKSRFEKAGLEPDFSTVKVPRQYMDVVQDAIEDRNRVGVNTMLTALSRGNPAIAIRLFADCLKMNDQQKITVTLPANRDDQLLKGRSINLLLVLRVIAQVEQVTLDDIVTNLRLESDVVMSAISFSLSNNWIEHSNGHYRIAWPWFRVITQVLGRQNLLAGVRQEIK